MFFMRGSYIINGCGEIFGVLGRWSPDGRGSLTRGNCKWSLDCIKNYYNVNALEILTQLNTNKTKGKLLNNLFYRGKNNISFREPLPPFLTWLMNF